MTIRTLVFVVLFSPLLAAQPALYDVVTNGTATCNGSGDDTSAIQTLINASPAGSIIGFGQISRVCIISSTLVLLPNRTYSATSATIRMAGSVVGKPPMAKSEYQASDYIVISGMVWDGNGVAGGIQTNVDGGIAQPAVGVQITNNVFMTQTPSPSSDAQGAIYMGSGCSSCKISGNQFISVGRGVAIINANDTEVSDNSFHIVSSGNAISLTFNSAPAYRYGYNVRVLRNSGDGLTRMAVEAFPSEALTSSVSGLQISDNNFSDWGTPIDGFPYCISDVVGSQATISGNRCLNGVAPGWGIELSAQGSIVSGNTITGFDQGISLEDAATSAITGNTIIGPSNYGIVFTNSGGSRSNITVSRNAITNAKVAGIFVNSAAWGGSTIVGNKIIRPGGGWAGDNTATFTGISIFPPAAAVSVTNNVITQSATAGPSGFTFQGIAINGGAAANTGSLYAGNTVSSAQTLAASSGLTGNAVGSMNGVIARFNTLQGLNGASGGPASSGLLAIGNVILSCVGNGNSPINH